MPPYFETRSGTDFPSSCWVFWSRRERSTGLPVDAGSECQGHSYSRIELSARGWRPRGVSGSHTPAAVSGASHRRSTFRQSKDSKSLRCRLAAQTNPWIRHRFEIRNVTQKLGSVTEKSNSVTKNPKTVTENSRLGLSSDASGTSSNSALLFPFFSLQKGGSNGGVRQNIAYSPPADTFPAEGCLRPQQDTLSVGESMARLRG
jgi:hypothetical protein